MNEYRFRDLVEGQTELFSHVVTLEDMQNFLRLTGDTNPLHKMMTILQEVMDSIVVLSMVCYQPRLYRHWVEFTFQVNIA